MYLKYEAWLSLNQELVQAYIKMRKASDAASMAIDAIIESEINSWPSTTQLMNKFVDENNERDRLLSVITQLRNEYEDSGRLLEQQCPVHHIILERLGSLFKTNTPILQP